MKKGEGWKERVGRQKNKKKEEVGREKDGKTEWGGKQISRGGIKMGRERK